MLIFVGVAIVCLTGLAITMLVDDFDIGDALDFVDDGGAGWFSLRALLLGGIGFGATGALALTDGVTYTQASMIGVAGGVVLYMIGVGMAILLNKQESNSLYSLDSLVGKVAVVDHPIYPGSPGRIQVVIPGQGTVYQQAMAADPFEVGERVEVVMVTPTTAWVKAARAEVA